jgi:hypothetical protein
MARKQTSPKVSALAAKYLNMSDDEMWDYITAYDDRAEFCAGVRSMAASLLSQDEIKGQK